MTKIICEECKKEIDDTHKQCPHCGYKNKLNIDLYLKEQNTNNICPKCCKKLNKNDIFCTKCGTKKNDFKTTISKIIDVIKVIYKRNKIIINISAIILIFLLTSIIYCNNFNKDMVKAERLYNNHKYYEAENIIEKYPIHFNNETYRKINATKFIATYYNSLSVYNDDTTDDYINTIKNLLWGYERCDEELSLKPKDVEKQAIEDFKKLFRYTLQYDYKISETKTKELLNLNKDERDKQIEKLAKEIKKANTCEKNNIDVLRYDKYGYKMSVTLKNNNGCSWNIKSYSEVRVYFTDGSYEDVYLSTNINLKADESYTFSGCYLGSDNEYKTIRSVSFID